MIHVNFAPMTLEYGPITAEGGAHRHSASDMFEGNETIWTSFTPKTWAEISSQPGRGPQSSLRRDKAGGFPAPPCPRPLGCCQALATPARAGKMAAGRARDALICVIGDEVLHRPACFCTHPPYHLHGTALAPCRRLRLITCRSHRVYHLFGWPGGRWALGSAHAGPHSAWAGAPRCLGQRCR